MSIDKLSSYSLAQWRAVADRETANIETRLFIGGKFVDAIAGGRFDTINPANREVLAAMSHADEQDVDIAVSEARKAFRVGRAWPRAIEWRCCIALRR